MKVIHHDIKSKQNQQKSRLITPEVLRNSVLYNAPHQNYTFLHEPIDLRSSNLSSCPPTGTHIPDFDVSETLTSLIGKSIPKPTDNETERFREHIQQINSDLHPKQQKKTTFSSLSILPKRKKKFTPEVVYQQNTILQSLEIDEEIFNDECITKVRQFPNSLLMSQKRMKSLTNTFV